jgi:hypothetical protein
MISEAEFGIWTRGRVHDVREFGLKRKTAPGYVGLSQLWTGVDEYAAIFSREQIEKGEFDTIFVEVDAHKPGEDWNTKLQQVLARTEEPSRRYESGRGAHLYWDLDEPIKGVGRYKQVVAALVRKWGIGEFIDMHVVGDVRRVARLPMSKNSKGGEMIRINSFISGPRKLYLVIGEAKDGPEQHFGPAPEAKRLYSEGEYPPCVRAGIKQIQQTGELDHAQRLHTFSFLVMNDETQKAYEILKRYAGDFDPVISGYQLGRMAEKGHFPYKCANVPKDLCPYTNQKECMFWPWVNVHRNRLLEASKHAR